VQATTSVEDFGQTVEDSKMISLVILTSCTSVYYDFVIVMSNGIIADPLIRTV